LRLRRFGFGGTFLPARRASESPIAIACLPLFTLPPERPLRAVPLLYSRISLRTLSDAPRPYLRRPLLLFLRVDALRPEVDFFRAGDAFLRLDDDFFRVEDVFLRDDDFLEDDDFLRTVDFVRVVNVFLRAGDFLRVVLFLRTEVALRFAVERAAIVLHLPFGSAYPP